MKKSVVVFSIMLFSLASCTKDYTCTCRLADESYTYDMKDIKKKDVDEACDIAGEVWISAGGKCTASEV